MMHNLSLEFFLSGNKIKETSSDNQIYSFFETLSCWKSKCDYFKLWMQACIIFLSAIVQHFLFELKVGNMFKGNNEDTRTTTCIVDFEQVNVCREHSFAFSQLLTSFSNSCHHCVKKERVLALNMFF